MQLVRWMNKVAWYNTFRKFEVIPVLTILLMKSYQGDYFGNQSP
jgi:hypothetical protein